MKHNSSSKLVSVFFTLSLSPSLSPPLSLPLSLSLSCRILVLTEEKDTAIKKRETRVRDECNIELRDRLGALREEERLKREREKEELVTKAREELKETNDQRLSEIKVLRLEVKNKEKVMEI